jgi:hypothetical protein
MLKVQKQKGMVSRDLLLFHESSSLKPLKLTLGSFQILSIIRKSSCTISVNDTGSKFATSINNTGSKFATGVKDTVGK